MFSSPDIPTPHPHTQYGKEGLILFLNIWACGELTLASSEISTLSLANPPVLCARQKIEGRQEDTGIEIKSI